MSAAKHKGGNQLQDRHARTGGQRDGAKARVRPEPENKLRRETRFVAEMRFKADLPEMCCDPKQLSKHLTREELGEFSITRMECQPRRDLSTHMDLREQIYPLLIHQYDISENPPALDPEDAELLNDGEDLEVDPASKLTRRQSAGALSWLMRTTYISNDMPDHSVQQLGAERLTKKRAAEEEAMLQTREGQVHWIEGTFRKVRRKLTHPKNPKLKPVKQWTVLPDFDHWRRDHAAITFENDPTEDSKKLSRLSEEHRRSVADRALVRFMEGADNEDLTVLGYMAPCDLPPGYGTSDGGVDDGAEGEYAYIKEYSFEPRAREADHKPVYVFAFEDECVRYVELAVQAQAKKRRMTMATSRPSKVVVTRSTENSERRQSGNDVNEANGDEVDLF
ncbi:unnamed protein product [Ostreobium quekettii]|uniref:Uncharacterized protein n=1 Tax=Ostreobium quekettii TaxID=121088 RepID=A0A8S1IL42_9CHLO|nr:unnamed protein product [Ostreobium quekettii]|eukprot:evm.model.scf_2440.2 EVM.evm.TU.scf_2440.2   scf_2440:7669-14638(-)